MIYLLVDLCQQGLQDGFQLECTYCGLFHEWKKIKIHAYHLKSHSLQDSYFFFRNCIYLSSFSMTCRLVIPFFIVQIFTLFLLLPCPLHCLYPLWVFPQPLSFKEAFKACSNMAAHQSSILPQLSWSLPLVPIPPIY